MFISIHDVLIYLWNIFKESFVQVKIKLIKMSMMLYKLYQLYIIIAIYKLFELINN